MIARTAPATEFDSGPSGPPPSLERAAPVSRTAVIDAAARLITSRGDHKVRWTEIAYEAGNTRALLASEWFDDDVGLIDECYARTAQGLSDSLLRAETAPGTALDKVAAFLVTALELRRLRGAFLSFRRGGDLPASLQRRLHEHDTAVRTRLKRLLYKGRTDSSLALRNPDTAVELILANLQVPTVVVDGPEQRMWDCELTELLLAGLSEPHPLFADTAEASVAEGAVLEGSCQCGAVRYEIRGPFDILSHCQCSVCRRHHSAAHTSFVATPLSRFLWVTGESELSTYRPIEGAARSFCRICGSAAPVIEKETGIAYCPATGSTIRSPTG